MNAFILAQKSKQSQSFNSNKDRVSTTALNTSPCYLIAIKEPKRDGYMSVQLGFGKAHAIPKPQQGQLKKAGIKTPLRFFREFRIDASMMVTENGKQGIQIGEAKVFIGEEVKPSLFFKVGDTVSVSATSKGKGFQGVVKRHGFRGQLRTHGYPKQRAVGSIGATTTPGHVFKGQRMAGRMGHQRVTVQNLAVLSVDETGMTVQGLVPGPLEGLVEVRTV